MLRSYGELFKVPGSAAFSATGLLGRIPISMIGISVVLLVSETTGKYAIAGLVTAFATLAGAVVMPQLSRLVDRYGQRVITRRVVIIGAGALALLIIAVTLEWPRWTWFVFAMIGGASQPSVGSMVRARWTHTLPDPALRQRAFSWEASLDEIVFILGPPIATLLATMVSPYAGLLAAVIILVVGGFAFTAQRSTEPPPSLSEDRVSSRSLIKAPLIALAGIFFTSGIAFGAIEVTTVAFADEAGRAGISGLILAAYAAGSLISGLSFGVIKWKRSLGGQFVIAAVVFALLTPLLLLAANLAVLTVVMFICGFAVAPVLISGTLLIERIVPPAALTEGLTWSITAVITGVTVGAAVAGQLIDNYGARTAYLMPVAGAVLGGLIAVVSRRWLTAKAVAASQSRSGAHSEVDSSMPGTP